MGKLTELRYLNLSKFLFSYCYTERKSQIVRDLIECISTLSKLEHLYLCQNHTIESLPESFSNLRKLHTLDLSSCYGLEKLPKGLGEIDSLKFLNVADCDQLDESTVPQLGSSLLMSSPYFVVQAGDGESSSNLFLLQHAMVQAELKICSLENVKSAEEAHSIKLSGKHGINWLRLEWTEEAERFVEDIKVLGELKPPSTLRRFELRGYNGVSFPAWLMGISHYLPNIVEIKVWDLPKCSSLPPLGQLPNLQMLHLRNMHSIKKIDEGFCGGARAFPQLKKFYLRSMQSLEEWNTANSYGDFMFPNLEELEICDCPKLRLKPCPPRATDRWVIQRSDEVISSWGQNVTHTGASSSSALVKHLDVMYCEVPLHQWRLLHHLPALPRLTMVECSDLTSSPEIIRDLSSLQSLYIRDRNEANVPKYLELPKWLGEVTSLRELQITGYLEQKELQGNMRQLTSLQSLSLNGYLIVEPLPQWLGELTSLKELEIASWTELNNLQESLCNLTSLQSLKLIWCRSIPALPEGVCDLTSLKKLEIRECEGIKSLPESIQQLTSLKKLEIWKCEGIKSLPESIQQLTNLEELRIIDCPELKRWCESE